ncbi:MAG TPA: hypothetical protein VFB72_17865 [Verrucomicrobiae bacterium]|nr:hypothetical protein [Verrucomicrobiae bacterium]
MDVSGTRYLMPAQIAAGIVQFGHSNALDGPQMIAAVESALQKSDTGWWDAKAKKWRAEPLQLLRFPAQKTVVLLPKSEVADFLRTNGIDARRFGKALD